MRARAAVATAREQGNVGALGGAETELRLGLGNLFAVAEAYPELKANESFQHLQSRISGLEDSIADRREYYNEAVNNNNVRIEQFPDVLIAQRFGFGSAELLEFSEEEISDVDLKALFTG
jgi:LemA protein